MNTGLTALILTALPFLTLPAGRQVQTRQDQFRINCVDPDSAPLCKYQTCTLFGVLFFIPVNPYKSKLLTGSWNKKPCNLQLQGLVLVVIAPGFEPGTVCLEGRCSIQLSYATSLFRPANILMSPGV